MILYIFNILCIVQYISANKFNTKRKKNNNKEKKASEVIEKCEWMRNNKIWTGEDKEHNVE